MTRPLTALCVFAFVAAPVAQQMPVRDPDVRPTFGTASISGRVLTEEAAPHPVRRAIVTLSGTGLTPSRGAISDDDGRFVLANLPAGQFTLTVSRASFVTSTYGAKRPARPGTAITVGAGQQIDNLVVRLWRGAVIAGTVRDESGAPVPRVPVTAMPARPPGGSLTLSNNGTQTDDRGEYRIFGLEAGAYVVAAKPSVGGAGPLTALSESDVDRLLAAARRGASAPPTVAAPPTSAASSSKPFEFAPVFYPGTPSMGSATVVILQPGSEVTGVDIALQRVSTSVVSGVVTRPDGTPAKGATLQLTAATPVGAFASIAPRFINATADGDGAFRIPQVTPGDYTLVARAPAQPPPPAPPAGAGAMTVSPGGRGPSVWASTDVTVSGGDVEGLSLRLEPAMTVTGRVVFDGSAKPPADLTKVQVWLRPPNVPTKAGATIDSISFVFPAVARPDGTFEILNVLPGRYQLVTTIPGADGTLWSPRTALMEDRDLLEGETVISRGLTASLIVTFTDRRSELSGALQTASGTSTADVFVVAFSANRAYWMPSSRRVQAVRPDANGRYVIRGLPAGDYFVGVVTDVDQDEVFDPAFLEKLVPASARIAIGETEIKSLDLRLGGGGVLSAGRE